MFQFTLKYKVLVESKVLSNIKQSNNIDILSKLTVGSHGLH